MGIERHIIYIYNQWWSLAGLNWFLSVPFWSFCLMIPNDQTWIFRGWNHQYEILWVSMFFTKSHFGRGSMERGDLPQSWGHGRVSCQVLSWWGWMWTERWICGRGQSPKSNVAAIWAARRTYPSSCFPKDTCSLHHFLREFADYGILKLARWIPFAK